MTDDTVETVMIGAIVMVLIYSFSKGVFWLLIGLIALTTASWIIYDYAL